MASPGSTLPSRRSRWHAFHIYYYDDRDRVLLDVVRPIVRQLLEREAIDSFFFVRYGLGGPHVRLRLCVRPGWGERVAAEVKREARRLLELRPSLRQIEPDALARASGSLASRERAAGAVGIQPDNSCQRAAFEPEVERYGGARYLPASLGLFALSSATALRRLGQAACGGGRSRLLGVAAETLLRQALSFARDDAELERLLAYGLEQWGKAHPQAAERGLEAGSRQREALVALTVEEIERRAVLVPPAGLESAEDPLAAGSLLLSRILGRLEPARRARVGWSQLHMTANRLGLRNSEEVYLSALLGAAWTRARECHPNAAGELDLDATLGPTDRERVPVRALSTGVGPVLHRMLAGAGGIS